MQNKNRSGLHIRLPEFVLAVLIILSGISLAFSAGGFILNFKKAGFTVFSSIEKGIYFCIDGVKNTVNSAKELHKLKKEYNELVLKLDNYEQMQRTNADIRKENQRLKEQLDFATSLDEKNIPAQIISRDLDDSYAYITIDKGSVNGIKKNMPVVAYQNGMQGLVGKVVQVAPFTCQVMPVYNVDNMVSARIQNTRDIGLINGMGSQNQPLMMQYIRKRVIDELNYGDVVVTSGENDNYMKDIPIGTISKITILDYNSSLNIELTPVIDFSRLEDVIVVNQHELNDRKENN